MSFVLESLESRQLLQATVITNPTDINLSKAYPTEGTENEFAGPTINTISEKMVLDIAMNFFTGAVVYKAFTANNPIDKPPLMAIGGFMQFARVFFYTINYNNFPTGLFKAFVNPTYIASAAILGGITVMSVLNHPHPKSL